MNIKEFKEKCKEQRKRHDKDVKRWERLINIQEKEYLNRCFAPHKKFNWRKLNFEESCPNCEIKLEKEIIRSYCYGMDEGDDVIYYCSNCGYEYAR